MSMKVEDMIMFEDTDLLSATMYGFGAALSLFRAYFYSDNGAGGLIMFGVIGLLLLALCIYYIYRYAKKNNKKES